jgi:hypothetical protein
MDNPSEWESISLPCPENPDRTAILLVQKQEVDGEMVIKSISCDNPRLRDLDNWDCKWQCWEELARHERRRGP